MTIIEYAQRQYIYPYFTKEQIQVLQMYQDAKDNKLEFVCCLPMQSGKTVVINMINRYEGYMQGRAEAVEEYTDWLRKRHANFDEEYAEDIKSEYLEWLKEQKNE